MAFSAISLTDATLTTIAAAKTGYKVRLYSYLVKGDAATTVSWSSNSTVLGAVIVGAAGDGATAPPTPYGPVERVAWLETAVSEALKIQQSGTVNVKGHCEYEYVPAVN